MSKKLLTLLLTICLLVSQLSAVTLAEIADTSDYELYYKVLTELEIINDYEEFDFGSTMTKYEFVNMIENLYGDNKYGTVKSDTAINDAAAQGLISSVEAFQPHDDILYEEAVKIAICALGYGQMAEFKGGWYTGYFAVASNLGILQGVSGSFDTPMTKGNLIKLIYKMLDEPVMQQTVYGNNYSEFDTVDNATLLEIYRKIYKVEGTFEGNYYTMLYSRSTLEEDEVCISGERYIYDGILSDEYLGSTVKAYVREADNADVICSIVKKYSDDTITIPSEDIINMNAKVTELSYYNRKGKADSVRISPSAYVTYNGEFYADYTSADFKFGDGFVMLTDADDNGEYDTVKITSYDNMYVSEVFVSAKNITDKFDYDGAIGVLELGEDKTDAKIRYFSQDMTPLEFSDVAAGQILSVTTSKAADEPIITIYISDKTADGKFTAVGGSDKIIIDDTEYTLSESFKTANSKGDELAKLNIVGETVCVSIDAFGYVAAIEVTGESSLHYAYATKMGTHGSLDTNVAIKVFDSDEVWRQYELAEKVKWNGDLKTGEEIYQRICPTGKLTGQLIAYKLNKKGEINCLETGVTSDDTDRLRLGSDAVGRYRQNNRSIDWLVFFETSTKIWVVPEDKNAEDEYVIEDYTYLWNDLYEYTVTPYNLDDYKFAEHVVVTEKETLYTTVNKRGTLYVYMGMGQSRDENGNILSTIDCIGGQEGRKEYLLAEGCTVPDIKIGDVFQIELNKKNIITYIEKVYSLSDRDVVKIPSIMHGEEMMSGRITKIDYSKQRFIVDCGGDQTLRNDLFTPGATIIKNCNDGRKNEIDTCGFSDLEVGDYVVLRALGSRLYDVYIVKNL